MARIVKRGDNWYVTVSHMGKRYYKTLPTKPAAVAWGVETKAALTSSSSTTTSGYTIDTLMDRYIAEVHPHKPFAKSKMATIKLTAQNFKDVLVTTLTPEMIFLYAQKRRLGYNGRKQISGSTLNQEITYLAQTLDHARTLWGVNLPSNVARDALSALSKIDLVAGSRQRDRRVSDQELEMLLDAAESHRSGWMVPLIKLAVETGMRQKEICELRWEYVDFDASTFFIKDRKHPREKKGNDQIIPVSNIALGVIREWGVGILERSAHRGKQPKGNIFPMQTSAAVSDRFALVRAKAGITDLHFHDLRHEAISRLFEKGLQIHEVARISGHRDWKQLKRYTQLTAKSLVPKINHS